MQIDYMLPGKTKRIKIKDRTTVVLLSGKVINSWSKQERLIQKYGG